MTQNGEAARLAVRNRPARQRVASHGADAAGGVGTPDTGRVVLADSAPPRSSVSGVSPLLTPGETSAYLVIPIETLAKWRYKRTGPKFYRVGNHVRYKQSDLDAWLEAVAVVTA